LPDVVTAAAAVHVKVLSVIELIVKVAFKAEPDVNTK
jgi:hypothetical protein